MSQPTLGIRENIANIKSSQIKEFVEANFVGENIVVSTCGKVDHDQIAASVTKAFSGLKASANVVLPNSEQARFTPSVMFMRDDEMANVNIGVFFKAPTWKDPEFFAMHLFRELLGDYRVDENYAHINSLSRQYNTLHNELGRYPDVNIHNTFYFPYSDTALFGSYLHGNEVFGSQMYLVSQLVFTQYAAKIESQEIFRSKNRIYNHLLNNNSTATLAQDASKQITYLGRAIPRSEFAHRISLLSNHHLQRIIKEHFYDRVPSIPL